MSASNWAVCPKCKQQAEDKIKDAYGRVSASEYQELLKARDAQLSGNSATLREDWEIGIYNGVFEVSYSASCTECGFEFSYSHNENV